jgi:hypothetical protein
MSTLWLEPISALQTASSINSRRFFLISWNDFIAFQDYYRCKCLICSKPENLKRRLQRLKSWLTRKSRFVSTTGILWVIQVISAVEPGLKSTYKTIQLRHWQRAQHNSYIRTIITSAMRSRRISTRTYTFVTTFRTKSSHAFRRETSTSTTSGVFRMTTKVLIEPQTGYGKARQSERFQLFWSRNRSRVLTRRRSLNRWIGHCMKTRRFGM